MTLQVLEIQLIGDTSTVSQLTFWRRSAERKYFDQLKRSGLNDSTTGKQTVEILGAAAEQDYRV